MELEELSEELSDDPCECCGEAAFAEPAPRLCPRCWSIAEGVLNEWGPRLASRISDYAVNAAIARRLRQPQDSGE